MYQFVVTGIHCNRKVVMLTTIFSLAGPEAVKLSTPGAVIDQNFTKVTIFPFQCPGSHLIVVILTVELSRWRGNDIYYTKNMHHSPLYILWLFVHVGYFIHLRILNRVTSMRYELNWLVTNHNNTRAVNMILRFTLHLMRFRYIASI